VNIYLVSYYIHVACICLSGSFFFIRGLWMLMESELLDLKWVKILPHVIDTLLLGSAISLTIAIQQYPLVSSWLTVKVVALIMYILFGIAALRRGKTKLQRIIFFALAILTFGFMVTVALSHQPLGIFA
jgi:uncharacterized membrane protein SirB2